MNYVVLDLEWNQPRWAGETVEKPVHLVGEIVQIGAVLMDKRFSIKKELRLTCSPKFYRKMHRKVARITGLDNETVKKGIPFPEAFRQLVKFCGRDFVFLTWGPDDIPMLRDNLILFSLDEDWIPPSYDLQVLFSHQKTGAVRQFALEDAIEMLGEEPFQAHDALCDAKSTALICRHLDMKKGLEEYAALAGDITVYPIETGEVPVHFANRGEALRELESTTFPCPECEEYLLPEGLIPQNANKYLAVAECPEEKKYLVRFRLYRTVGDRIGATREVFAWDENLALFYEQKKERQEKLRAAERQKEKRKRARRREKREAEKALAAKDAAE
ncbi:MAG: exonuclease domain-containing protein [Clostridia bacterium]|nr:exonuclease domain-containing protein [Clostridia bacterium]